MMDLKIILNKIYPLSDESIAKMESITEQIQYPKGHILLRSNRIETNIFFLKKGIARAYSVIDDGEITFWFGMEGEPIISMKNYVNMEKSYENIELLEDCELYKISNNALQQLFLEDIEIANWGRKLAEKELLKTEERFISRQLKSATDRYAELLAKHPTLLQRVSLGNIASYLGITQVSLSRIRSEMR